MSCFCFVISSYTCVGVPFFCFYKGVSSFCFQIKLVEIKRGVVLQTAQQPEGCRTKRTVPRFDSQYARAHHELPIVSVSHWCVLVFAAHVTRWFGNLTRFPFKRFWRLLLNLGSLLGAYRGNINTQIMQFSFWLWRASSSERPKQFQRVNPNKCLYYVLLEVSFRFKFSIFVFLVIIAKKTQEKLKVSQEMNNKGMDHLLHQCRGFSLVSWLQCRIDFERAKQRNVTQLVRLEAPNWHKRRHSVTSVDR